MKAVRAAAILVAILVVSACSSTAGDGPTAHVSSRPAQATPAAPTLAAAIRASTHLGPAGGGTEVFLNFALKTRKSRILAALIASGQTVSPAQYEAEFGPDPALVQAAVRYLSTV